MTLPQKAKIGPWDFSHKSIKLEVIYQFYMINHLKVLSEKKIFRKK